MKKQMLIILGLSISYLGFSQEAITDTGVNVGIGISNPQKTLHINSPSDNGIAIGTNNALLGDNGSGVFTQLLFWNGTNVYYGRSTTGASIGNHFFRTGGTTRLSITGLGNVGIGTTNPSSLLEIADVNASIGESIGFNFTLKGAKASIKSTLMHSAHNVSNLSFFTDPDGGPALERMRITENGHIGIGRTNPLASLHIDNPLKNIDNFIITTSPIGEVPDNIFIVSNQNGSGVMKMKNRFGSEQISFSTEGNSYLNGGNVGIGITPTDKLHVNGVVRSNSKFVITGIGALNGDSSDMKMWSVGNLILASGSDTNEHLRIKPNGDIGIGTTTPDSKLTVAGNIHAREVKVTVNAGADFVFEDNYKLPSLNQLEMFIKTNKHLPEIASEKEMQENGLLLAEMNIKLLQKIEELTLYTIKQQKEIEILKDRNSKIEKLEQENKVLKSVLLRLNKIEENLKSK